MTPPAPFALRRAFPLLGGSLLATSLLVSLLSAPVSAQAQQAVQTRPAVQTLPSSRVVTYLGQTPGWFICDGLDRPGVSVMGWPDARGRSRLTTYSKTRPGEYEYRFYRVGGADVGAGQIHYPLLPTPSGGAPYSVGSFNIGALEHPEQAITPNIVTLDSALTRGDCRWTLNTRLLGFSARRSVTVTADPAGRLTYQSFNFADPTRKTQPDGAQRSSMASLSITGGRRMLSNSQESFVFENAGYTYTLRVARQGQPAGASLSVSRGGKLVQTEVLTGYTYAVRK